MNDLAHRIVLEGLPVQLFVIEVLVNDGEIHFATLAPDAMQAAAGSTVKTLARELQPYEKDILSLAPDTGISEVTKCFFFSRIADGGGVEISAHLSGIRGMDSAGIQAGLKRAVVFGIEAAHGAMLTVVQE